MKKKMKTKMKKKKLKNIIITIIPFKVNINTEASVRIQFADSSYYYFIVIIKYIGELYFNKVIYYYNF